MSQEQAAADGLGARSCYALVTGGGTGGHVQPALAIAEALVGRGKNAGEIHFVGSRRGMEGRLVSEAGYAITLLPGRGIRRAFSLANFGAIAGIATACIRALGILGRLRPAVVVTVGGYAGFPAALAGLVWRVPVLVVSYDAVAGAANRFIGRFAAANAVAFPGSGLPRARLTGAPVRSRVLDIQRSETARQSACKEMGLDPDRTVVLATGGSLGARTVNDSTVGLCRRWHERTDIAVYHVAGDRDLDAVRRAAGDAGLGEGKDGLDYRLTGYESRMPVLLAACDLIVARAGASTVAELCAVGIPSILVPLPRSPGDHQTSNARALSEAGAAVMVPDDQCTGERLAEVIEPLLESDALVEMGEAAAGMGRRDAADQIALLAMAIARSDR
ncbi:MAG: UDP-N-acetylglucosamine--N-acetylmuramyl-(pentapeptide) pyrophosphoryl-undecaprenol N-acetylglucosamine transferase [Acidimicrobiales bacterium]